MRAIQKTLQFYETLLHQDNESSEPDPSLAQNPGHLFFAKVYNEEQKKIIRHQYTLLQHLLDLNDKKISTAQLLQSNPPIYYLLEPCLRNKNLLDQ